MAIDPGSISNAAAAYARTAQNAGAAPLQARDDGGDDFASLIKSAIQGAVDTQKRAEQISMDAIRDKADMTDVITAVAEAEVTLQAVVSVRDKVIEAYKEIVRLTT